MASKNLQDPRDSPRKNQLSRCDELVNFWVNRVICDEAKPTAERFTKTNIRTLLPGTPLMPSGLLGPVRLLQPARR